MNLQEIQSYPKDRVRALFGLEPIALSQLLEAVLPELTARRLCVLEAKINRKRKPGGGRPRKLFPYQEVLLTLVYLRHNVSHAFVGAMFHVTADISENSFQALLGSRCSASPTRRLPGSSLGRREEMDQERAVLAS